MELFRPGWIFVLCVSEKATHSAAGYELSKVVCFVLER